MKSLIATICILGLVGMVVGAAVQAVDTATVTATVTPGEVSVSIDRNTVGYGVMLLNTSKADPLGAITATAGTSDIDINFTGANAEYQEGSGEAALCDVAATVDKCTWTLGNTPGTAIYEHSATIVATETPLTNLAQKLVDNLTAGTTKQFTLKMYTPSAPGTETA